ncbi:MAG: HipA N-terminal domain-containing protein, partial [Rhabdochlamydiaceae bacterium]|jgi:serine/threonine-protein kinase HipA
MPTEQKVYEFDRFPPFFEGLLPEGVMLEGLLRQTKLDRDDLMGQLLSVGGDVVGNVTIEAFE